MRPDSGVQLTGTSRQIRDLAEEIERIARSDAKVLITGESGVGKEVVARTVHLQSARRARPFVAVNCAGLTETLLESELFGHVKGSFTGAYRDKPGKLETADEGTIFLDEIGEMTLRMQALLLRFLETGELQKVGADHAGRRVNVRVVAATNRNLRDLISQGAFREDLFYRINVIHLIVPPLRERREDIAPMVHDFLRRFTPRDEPLPRTVAADALTAMVAHDWPGNVRELENVIERLTVISRKPVVSLDDLPLEIQRPHGVTETASCARCSGDETAEDLYRRVVDTGQSFWTTVYPLYMQRDITRSNVRGVISRALKEARGNYKIVVDLFNMDPADYKRFLNFLRKHDCQVPFQDYRHEMGRPAIRPAQPQHVS